MSHDSDATCRCASEHRPPVLEYVKHHVLPASLGGSDAPENIAWMCPTAHANCHELLRMMLRHGRTLTDYELQVIEDRPVSRYAAKLAREGFTRWQARG